MSAGIGCKIRFAPVGIDADYRIAAVGEANLVEAGALETEAICAVRASLNESGLRPSGSITSTFAVCTRRLRRRAQLHKRIHEPRSAQLLAAGKIARRAIDKRDKDRMQRQVVGEVVEARGEQQHAAFAVLLVEQQRRAIGEPRRNARLRRIDGDSVEDLHLSPAAVVASRLRLLERGIAEIHLADGGRTAIARIVARVACTAAPQRNARMMRRGWCRAR